MPGREGPGILGLSSQAVRACGPVTGSSERSPPCSRLGLSGRPRKRRLTWRRKGGRGSGCPQGAPGSPLSTRWYSRPSLAATAAVALARLDWGPPQVMCTSAAWDRASAAQYSSFRILFPERAMPVRSSLFSSTLSLPSRAESLPAGCIGVGRTARSNFSVNFFQY